MLLCLEALELLAEEPVALVEAAEDKGCDAKPETPKASVFRTHGASALRELPPPPIMDIEYIMNIYIKRLQEIEKTVKLFCCSWLYPNMAMLNAILAKKN